MDQLTTVVAKVAPKVRYVEGGLEVEDERVELTSCFPPAPSMTMNAITFGIHAIDSYLHIHDEC